MLSLSYNPTLLEGEQLIFRTRKHYIIFFTPLVYFIFGIIFLNDFVVTDTVNGAVRDLLRYTFLGNVSYYLPAIFLFMAAIGSGFWTWLTWRTSDFIITNKRLIMKEGYFEKYVQDLRLPTISQVSVNQDLLGQFIDYGTIIINTFGGATDYFFKIAQPKEFQKHLQSQLELVTQR